MCAISVVESTAFCGTAKVVTANTDIVQIFPTNRSVKALHKRRSINLCMTRLPVPDTNTCPRTSPTFSSKEDGGGGSPLSY